MQHHIPHAIDSIVIAGTAIATAAGSVILGQSASSEQSAELQLLLLPLIGSMVVSGAFIMLNPQPETRRIVIGRAMIALFCGVLAPQILGLFHPSLATLSVKPVFLILSGGLTAGLAYVLSKPFTSQLYARADSIAKREAERLEKRFSPPSEEEKPAP